jgi:beta-galactosidase
VPITEVETIWMDGELVPWHEAKVHVLSHALHYGTEDLNAGEHPYELPHRDTITLNLDLRQQGVGGDNSWGTWPHKEFLIPCQAYSYSFRLRTL